MRLEEEEEEATSEQDPDESDAPLEPHLPTDTLPEPHLPATDLPPGPHLQDEGACQGAYKIEYMC